MIAETLGRQARLVWGITAFEASKISRTSPVGLFSVFLEPLALLALMTFAMSIIRMRMPGMGDYLFLFLLTGVGPVFAFRLSVAHGERMVVTARNLYAFPQVRPLDLIASGTLLGFVIMVSLFLGVTMIFRLGFDTAEPQNLIGALVPIACNSIIGFGIAAVNLVITSWWPFWNRIFVMLLAPIGLLSGMFFTSEVLPHQIVQYLWWNPFFHSTEFCRHYFFPEYASTIFSPQYYFGWTFGALGVGLALERLFRLRIANKEV